MISHYWVELLSFASISAIVSLGLYIQMSSGQMNVGQAAFMGLGSYAAGLLTMKAGLPFGLALLLGGVGSALIGLLFAAVVLRLSNWWFSIASLAFGQAVVSIFSNIDYVGGITGFVGIPLKTTLWVIYGVLAVVILGLVALERSRFDLGVRAISSDEVAAMTSGVNAKMIRVCAFTLGSFIAGIGGGLQIHLLSVITPLDMSFHVSLNYFINVAVGGTRRFWGTLVAAYVLFMLPELLRFSAADRFILFGILLVIIMIFLPQGVMGQTAALGRLFSGKKKEATG